MYIPPREILTGLPLQKAELYGKPHLGAAYYREDIKATKRTASNCACCGRGTLRGNVHHIANRGLGRNFLLKSKYGIFVLLPSLAYLCGSGTTGCHGRVHERLIRIEWQWDNDGYAEMWWSGWTLSHGMKPHDKRLYEQGAWLITANGTTREVRHG